MSSLQPEEPRRSARAKKLVERLDPGGDAAGKRPNGARRAGSEEDSLSSASEEDNSEEEARPSRGNKRQSKATKNTRKATNGHASTRVKKTATVINGEVGPETSDVPKTDCGLFNALLSPDIALQPLIEDWVETYQQSAGDPVSEAASVHELILFFIRCCGLNEDIEEAEAMDADGVIDVLERIQDEIVKTAPATYPLISKTKPYRSFKTNLDLLIPHLISTLSLTPLLYQDTDTTNHSIPLLPLILTWLNSMSSSPLRPIRHTSTYLNLKINSALCEVASGVSKDLGIKQRQREAETKKAGPGAAAQKKVKEAEERVKDTHERKVILEEYMQEIVDAMFVHRVRDADPAIRTDCLKELGVWLKKYPEEYVKNKYFGYLTRGCNDPNSHARLETIKALALLYSKETFVTNSRSFTLRLAPRLVEMATRDVEVSVRVHSLSVITLIDKTGILEDENEVQRSNVAKLIFDQEPRVRKAVGGFMIGLWEEKKESMKAGWAGVRGAKKKRAHGISEDVMEKHLEWRALSSLLVETSKELDEPNEGTSKQAGILTTISRADTMTRAAAAVEAMWKDFELLRDWEGLVDYLLLDHSTEAEDMWLMPDVEEDFMLQVLIVCIRREEEDDDDEKTKTLMKVLPRLFAQNQADNAKMAGILAIPQYMNLDLYLDMRMSPAYEALWDDITKQFLQQTSPLVLSAANQAINQLHSATSLSAINTAKLSELEESLFSSLRDAIGGEDVMTLSLDEDRVSTLEAIMLRIGLLGRSRDLSGVMEDQEGGQSSGWDIICAFAERGKLGYKEEAKLVENALQIVFLHLTWAVKSFSSGDANDDQKVTALMENRDRAVEIFETFGVKDRTNAVELVRRQAFICFINLYVLFSTKPESPLPAASSCPLEMKDEQQHKLGGAFQAAVERYASDLEDTESEDHLSEFLFLQLVSVFVGAVRCGVLEVDHAKEPLAHYGRFSSAYDAVVRKLVDVLRDEGIYNKEAETVQNVAAAALQSSMNMFLDSEEEEPVATISLAKLIASAFVVHGNHFAILKQIHPTEVYDLHVHSLNWLSSKMASFFKLEQSAKNKNVKRKFTVQTSRCLSFFKVLLLLLGPITAKDAFRIKKHLDMVVEGMGVGVTGTKIWEGYRVYERRLVALISKDPSLKNAEITKKKALTEEVVEDTDTDEVDNAARSPELVGDQETTTSDPIPIVSTPSKRGLDDDEEDDGLVLDVWDGVGSPTGREKSASVEPVAKKRKTVKR
ncbi:cohesin complex subunit SA-1/2, partial [Tremellales sp. Uapishka_1]